MYLLCPFRIVSSELANLHNSTILSQHSLDRIRDGLMRKDETPWAFEISSVGRYFSSSTEGGTRRRYHRVRDAF